MPNRAVSHYSFAVVAVAVDIAEVRELQEAAWTGIVGLAWARVVCLRQAARDWVPRSAVVAVVSVAAAADSVVEAAAAAAAVG